MFPLEIRPAFEQENQNVLGNKETQRSHTLTRKLCNYDRNYTNCLDQYSAENKTQYND